MMLHIIIDGRDGKYLGAGAISVDSIPETGDVVEMETFGNGSVKLQVVETHHTSKRLSTHFTEETEWAYCRRL